jgi:hypothetical protein
VTDRCAIPGCRAVVAIVYLGRGICAHHWDQLTAEDQPADALARALGIPVAEATTTEDSMSEETTTETAKRTKGTKKAKAERKSAKKTKAAKEPKPKKERKPKEDQPKRVFAFRLHDEELAAIHRTAGPRNASRFIRAVAAAFAAEDRSAFEKVLKEARESRA